MTDIPAPPRILTRPDASTIAYRQLDGDGPGVVFLGGFMSDMEGAKALALEAHCRNAGRAFLRFDYGGHGQSSGAFEDGTISSWTDDAAFAVEQLTEGPQVLVGSSMGGWIMLLLGISLNTRVAGLLGIAAAPDFTEDLIARDLTDGQRATLERDGSVSVACDYDDEPYVITQALIEDGRRRLLLGAPITIDVPVRLIQGMKDEDVPWRTALKVQEMLASRDVEVTLVKDGDHRMSEAGDLERLTRTLDALLSVLD